MVLLVVLSEMGDKQILEELKVFHSKPPSLFFGHPTTVAYQTVLRLEAEAFILTWLKLTHEDERLYFF